MQNQTRNINELDTHQRRLLDPLARHLIQTTPDARRKVGEIADKYNQAQPQVEKYFEDAIKSGTPQEQPDTKTEAVAWAVVQHFIGENVFAVPGKADQAAQAISAEPNVLKQLIRQTQTAGTAK